MQKPDETQRLCFGCNRALTEPYIRCKECVPPFCFLCLSCYASGKEFGLHENTHPYQIIRSTFPLFSDNWTAAEELKLVEAIEKYGLGNWEPVALMLKPKTKEECKSHYLNCYIYNPCPELPELQKSCVCADNWPVPFPYQTGDVPPRPSLSSHRFNELAGYMAARGDFAYENDNYTERNVKLLDFENVEDDLSLSLMFAALEILNTKLKERARWKAIMREYGLINQSGSFLTNSRYSTTISKICEQLSCFSSLLHAEDLYKFLEGLHLEFELKQRISNLKEYREMGIRHFYSIPTYENLKSQQMENDKMKRCALTEVLNNISDERTLKNWLYKKAFKEVLKPVQDVSKLVLNRKPAAPLDILGVPGYEKLNDKERELCSTLRLVPLKFLHYKNLLINENERCGMLKLGQARSLVKIDVNKTRKIYNYLLEAELVKKA